MKLELEKSEAQYIVKILSEKPEAADLTRKITDQIMLDCSRCIKTHYCTAGYFGSNTCHPEKEIKS